MGLGKSRLERFRASKPASRRRTFNSSDCSSSSQLETAWAGGGGAAIKNLSSGAWFSGLQAVRAFRARSTGNSGNPQKICVMNCGSS